MSTALFLSRILLIDAFRPDWTFAIDVLINVGYDTGRQCGSCL